MTRLKVLFLCTGNSCRSQMAEGWTRHLKADEIEAYSAGTAPHGVNHYAIQVMKECDIDISTQTSQHLDAFADIDLDVIVTVCSSADKSCPQRPGNARKIHRGFDDPPKLAGALTDEDAILACYRRVRDEIRDFVAAMPASLHEPTASPHASGK